MLVPGGVWRHLPGRCQQAENKPVFLCRGREELFTLGNQLGTPWGRTGDLPGDEEGIPWGEGAYPMGRRRVFYGEQEDVGKSWKVDKR